MISTINFALPDAEDNTSRPLNKKSRFTFADTTINNLPKVVSAKIVEGGQILCFNSISKLDKVKDHVATITSLFELDLRHRFILMVQTKKSELYELRLQHKQLKTMEMTEGYIHQVRARLFDRETYN